MKAVQDPESDVQYYNIQNLLLLMQLKFHFLAPTHCTCRASRTARSLCWRSTDLSLSRLLTVPAAHCTKQRFWFKGQFSEPKSGGIFMTAAEKPSQISELFTHPCSWLKTWVISYLEKITLQQDLFFLLATFLGIFLPKQNKTCARHRSMKNGCPVPYFLEENTGHSWQRCFFISLYCLLQPLRLSCH